MARAPEDPRGPVQEMAVGPEERAEGAQLVDDREPSAGVRPELEREGPDLLV